MIAKYLKQTGKHSIIYGFGSLISKIIAFILIPVYTRVLSTDEYGVLSLMTVTLNIVIIMLSLGLQTTLFRFYIYDYTKEKDRRNLVSTIVIFLFLFSLLVVAVLYIYADNISELFFATADYGQYLRIIFITSFFDVGSLISLSILRSKAKSKIYSLYIIARLIIQIGLILYFMVYLDQGVIGALRGMMYAFMIFFIMSLPIIIKNIDFRFSFVKLKKILRFSIPLVPAALASWVMTMIDRFLLERMIGSSIVGIYTLGYNIGMMINFLFVAPVQLAWAQIMWSILKKEEKAKNIFSYIIIYYVLLGGFLFTGITVFSEEIIKIISTEAYYQAAIIVPYIALSYLFYGIYFMINIGINLKRRTEISALILIICGAINIFSNIILIPKYSMLGAAISTIISYSLLIILTYFVSNYFYQINYQWNRIIKIILVIIFILIVDRFIPEFNIIWLFIIKIILILLFFALLYLIKFFEAREIEKIKYYIRESLKNIRTKIFKNAN